MSYKLTFEPWVPNGYNTGNSRYGRLLILGESHYDESNQTYDESQKDLESDLELDMATQSSLSNFTNEILDEFINDEANIPFFRNLGLMFNPQNRFEVWNNVAFANGIQVLLKSSNQQPSQEEIATVKDSWWQFLDSLQPDKVLVCSQRMWNYWLPDSDSRGHLLRHLEENNKRSTIWRYNRVGGITHAMAINHPSRFFSHKNWKPLVEKFLETDFNEIS